MGSRLRPRGIYVRVTVSIKESGSKDSRRVCSTISTLTAHHEEGSRPRAAATAETLDRTVRPRYERVLNRWVKDCRRRGRVGEAGPLKQNP